MQAIKDKNHYFLVVSDDQMVFLVTDTRPQTLDHIEPRD